MNTLVPKWSWDLHNNKKHKGCSPEILNIDYLKSYLRSYDVEDLSLGWEGFGTLSFQIRDQNNLEGEESDLDTLSLSIFLFIE